MKNGNLFRGLIITVVTIIGMAGISNEVYQTTTIGSIKTDVALLVKGNKDNAKEHEEMKEETSKVIIRVDTLERQFMKMKLTTLKQ